MKILSVLTEYGASALDRYFTYLYAGSKRLEPSFRVRISFGKQTAMGFVIEVLESDKTPAEIESEKGFPLKTIEDADIIDEEPLLNDSLLSLAQKAAAYYFSPLISVLQAMLPPSLSPRLSALKGPKIAYEKWVELDDPDETGLTDKQIEALRLIAHEGPLPKKEAGSPSIVSKLIAAKRIHVFLKEKSRFRLPPIEERESPHEMTPLQHKAFDEILSSKKGVVLLQGVTGSGKTEVYLRLSEHFLKAGKTVLMLVPEINLTPAMVEYFSRRFGPKVAILHSELTPAERYDEYRRIARGEATIVVGARSAVFAPLSHLGLVILDEEHVESYKQENRPYYHAREIAIMRGEMEGAKVVLGSATPTLESKARAMKGVYGYSEMAERINNHPLPLTSIIDLRDRRNRSSDSEKLSAPLLDKMAEKLRKGEQTLLLLNRRGYWTGIECPKCGYIFVCPECGGNLTYHREDEMLKCHHCGHVRRYPSECPNCGNHALRRIGYGTERVLEEVERLFPSIRIARMDSDVGKVSHKVESILRAFHDGEYDVLVGTQMIAKGHDFPLVTLSSVVLADIGFSLPTYRSSERTFELIAQAVGRSGRSSRDGEALIQTYNPDHYAIQYGAKQDYEGFYRHEMQERRIAQYPPYVYLILAEFTGKNEERTALAAMEFKKELESLSLPLIALGPLMPFHAIEKGRHRRNVLLKFKDRSEVEGSLRMLLKKYAGKGGVLLSYNVDPLDS